jgi:hypothetical protein
MRRPILIYLAISALALLISGRSVSAQLCFSYSNDLGEYDSVSTDGTTIYTSTVIDGSQQMDAWGFCVEIIGSAVHTPFAYNRLTSGSQAVGGGT